MTVARDDSLTIRALARDDLSAVVAIDAGLEGRSRRAYVERRLAAAVREPELHAQFAASDGSGLVGYVLARVLMGEFGRTDPGLRLELVGVRPDGQRHGTGRRLFDALQSWARRHDVHEVLTSASWHDASMLNWLRAMGFVLAPRQILERRLPAGADAAGGDPVTLSGTEGERREVDFGTPESNDFERLARGHADVRPMTQDDLREIVRIDRSIIGRDRSAYIAGRLAEAMNDSAIRVSLTARLDGAIVGYLMARADLGDYGRAEPVALIDTLGVDAGYAQRGVGRDLLARLFANLGALQIEQVETVVDTDNLALLGFFQHAGLRPSQRLPFVRRLAA